MILRDKFWMKLDAIDCFMPEVRGDTLIISHISRAITRQMLDVRGVENTVKSSTVDGEVMLSIEVECCP
jgi:hypothetical protein